jgi:hypothetical protein
MQQQQQPNAQLVYAMHHGAELNATVTVDRAKLQQPVQQQDAVTAAAAMHQH